MYCVVEYPAKPENIHIKNILKKRYDKIGYSDHTKSNTGSIMAYTYGARYFEKHFSLRSYCLDAAVSLLPGEFTEYIKVLKEAENMIQDGRFIPDKVIVDKISLGT
jgi:sialic acid synthase SpsE